MKKRYAFRLRLFLVNIIILFMVTGCAARQVRLTETGFLSDYSGLKEDEDSGGMQIYRNPDANVGSRYSKILIAPLQFKLDSAATARKIKDKDWKELSDYFYGQLKEALEGNYQIVDSPGQDVLIFRSAVTNIVPNIGILNINMISLFSGTGLGGASLEAELVGSIDGERVMAFTDARKGRKFKTGFETWGHAEEALGFWAGVIAENLNRLKTGL